jgi:hypothetical protein
MVLCNSMQMNCLEHYKRVNIYLVNWVLWLVKRPLLLISVQSCSMPQNLSSHVRFQNCPGLFAALLTLFICSLNFFILKHSVSSSSEIAAVAENYISDELFQVHICRRQSRLSERELTVYCICVTVYVNTSSRSCLILTGRSHCCVQSIRCLSVKMRYEFSNCTALPLLRTHNAVVAPFYVDLQSPFE